jgi:hypothetical protein
VAHAIAIGWVGWWAFAIAAHGSRTGDVAGIIGAVGFLVGAAVVILLGVAAFAIERTLRWRWWIEAAALAALSWWYVAWFVQAQWKL